MIGSGATAVTLIPSLAAEGAEHVTMLQRSPTYIVPVPARERMAEVLRPLDLAAALPTRWCAGATCC